MKDLTISCRAGAAELKDLDMEMFEANLSRLMLRETSESHEEPENIV